MSLLLEKYGIFEPLRRMGLEGFPLFGTCAGAILLGRGEGIPRRLEIVPVELRRNAYGTQLDSFSATLSINPFREPFHGVFIRAPKIVGVEPPEAEVWRQNGVGRLEEVDVLGAHEGVPVLVASGSCLLSTFHPELTDDLRVHRLFLERFVGTVSKAPSRVVEDVATR
jgi:5'-phosphate synthase pdxT subunit